VDASPPAAQGSARAPAAGVRRPGSGGPGSGGRGAAAGERRPGSGGPGSGGRAYDSAMTRPGRPGRPPSRPSARPGPGGDPLAGVELVIVDGSNLLHALSRPAPGGGTALPASAVVGRIRGAIPAAIHVQLHLDGPPSGVRGRLATEMDVQHSGRVTADSRIVDLVRRYGEAGPAATWELLVVTDDYELRNEVQRRGARSIGTSWLIARIGSAGVAGPDPASAARPAGVVPAGGRPSVLRRIPVPGPRPRAGTGFGHGRPPRPVEGSGSDDHGGPGDPSGNPRGGLRGGPDGRSGRGAGRGSGRPPG